MIHLCLCWYVNKYEIGSHEQEKTTLVLKDDKANWYGRRGMLILIWRYLKRTTRVVEISWKAMIANRTCKDFNDQVSLSLREPRGFNEENIPFVKDFNNQVSLSLREPRGLTKWRKCTFREAVDPIDKWRGKRLWIPKTVIRLSDVWRKLLSIVWFPWDLAARFVSLHHELWCSNMVIHMPFCGFGCTTNRLDLSLICNIFFERKIALSNRYQLCFVLFPFEKSNSCIITRPNAWCICTHKR